MNFFRHLRPTAIYLLLVFALHSCQTSSEKTVSLETVYLPAFNQEGKLKTLFFVNDTPWVAYIDHHGLVLYNTTTCVMDSVIIDRMPNNIQNLDVINGRSFAFCTNDSVFVYQNGNFSRIRPQLPQNVVLSVQDVFAFFPQERKLIVEVVDYNDRGKGILENNYLFLCDYLGITTPIELKADKEYRTYDLGSPKTYFSKFSKGLVLGMEYSQKVHKVSFSDHKIELENISLAGPFDASTLFVANTDELTDKMDNMFLRLHYNNYFGKVFYNEKKDQLIRLYDFPISDKKIDGSYLHRKNKKKGFIIQGENKILHTLPANRYFDRSQWYFNNNAFYYLKWCENDKQEVYFLMDKVQIHNY